MLKNQLHFKPLPKNKQIKKKQSKIILEKVIYKQFKSKYSNDKDFYNRKISNEIISNETAHIVAVFKDYLISDDTSEFFQRYYSMRESIKKLPKIYEYYESCSVIFPNYVMLHEAKYICKNIQRKQRLIDNQQIQEEEQERKKKEILILDTSSEDNVFDTRVYDSLINITETNSVIQKAFGAEPPLMNDVINSDNKSNDKDDSVCKIVSSIEKNEKKQERTRQNRQFSISGLKGDYNTIAIEKVPTTYQKSKNFFLSNFNTTESNKSKEKGYNNSKNKQEQLYTQTISSYLTKNQKQKVTPIPINTQKPTKIDYHKNTFSVPKLSPRIFHVINKHMSSVKTLDVNHVKSQSRNQFSKNKSGNSDFIPLTSRESSGKTKLNLKAELYELISTKFKKKPNMSKKTITNISTATPSLSLKAQQQHHNQQYHPKQSNNGGGVTSTSQTKNKTHDNPYDKYQKKQHPSGHKNTRNVMLNKMNCGIFSYDFSSSPMTELFKTTRQITITNEYDKRTDKNIKSFHIKGFEDMLLKKDKGLTPCHSNRDKGLMQESISKLKNKRLKDF